ncbi:hypothetical protein FALBO_1244 [Fusarium albosuccineum]|uniref:Uncharacterized protein n=1 Tax=Fusarium albosuccineum TaxID=1237068 RepID=A0A8H4LLL8_9HYPO|nr:hypothetical protein FALBO_1244 [Fusarium albosuccineum]
MNSIWPAPWRLTKLLLNEAARRSDTLQYDSFFILAAPKAHITTPPSILNDPSLVFAGVVSKEALNLVEKISDFQSKIDSRNDELNSLVAMKRSLEITRTELLNLGVDVKTIGDALDGVDSVNGVNKEIAATAATFAKRRFLMKGRFKNLAIRFGMLTFKSRVQWTLSKRKSRRCRSPTTQSTWTSSNFLWMVLNRSQTSIHGTVGTLVLAVSCTHENASLLARLVLNVEKESKSGISSAQIAMSTQQALLLNFRLGTTA